MKLSDDIDEEGRVKWVRCFDEKYRAMLEINPTQIGDLLLIEGRHGNDSEQMLVIGVGDTGFSICQDILGLCIRSNHLKGYNKATNSLCDGQLYLGSNLNTHYAVIGEYDEVAEFFENDAFRDWFNAGIATWVMATCDNDSRPSELVTKHGIQPLLVPMENNMKSFDAATDTIARGVFELRNMIGRSAVSTNGTDEYETLQVEEPKPGFLICQHYESNTDAEDVVSFIRRDLRKFQEMGVIDRSLQGVLASIAMTDMNYTRWVNIENTLVKELGKTGMNWHTGMPTELISPGDTLQVTLWGI